MSIKLIIVEGLPGSGKSTVAQLVCDILNAKGIEAELFLEGNLDHPADYDGVSYFSCEEFTMLENTHFESRELLNRIKVKHPYLDGYLFPYKKAVEEQQISFENELLQDLTKNDIYELAIDLHIVLMLHRWNDFATSYEKKDIVVVFECCFIQNPVTVTMIKNNCHKEVTTSFINKMAELIMPLEPLLIYVEQDDIEKSFLKTINERPVEWLEGFTNYYTNQGFGLAHNLMGIDGVIEVLKARSNFEMKIYDSLNLTKYKIDNSTFNLALLNENLIAIISTEGSRLTCKCI